MGISAKALVLHGAKDLRIETHAISAPGDGEVLIEIARGGICGSDLHYFNHGAIGPIIVKQPMILGHEVAGTVMDLGPGVHGLKSGDLVAVSPSRPCGECGYCREGLAIHCENMRFYGSAMPFPHIQGAFSQRLVARAEQCVIADGLNIGEAAMAEPLAVCLHAINRAGNILGKRVLITGSGPIGVLTLIAAKAAGAAHVTITDLSKAPLAYAIAAGADQAIDLGERPDALEAMNVGKGIFDIVFECSGAQAAVRSAIPVLKPRGVLIQIGLGGDMTLPMQPVAAKEIELRGSFRFHGEFATAVRLMQDKRLDVKPLISHTLAMDEAVAAFEVASDRSRAMKVQLAFN